MVYYPNGHDSGHADFISVCFHLDDDSSPVLLVKARARFSLLDQAGKPVPSHTRTTGLCEFSERSHACGFPCFIRRDFLEKSKHLRDDCFKISCDVSVPKELQTEDRSPSRRSSPPLVDVPPSDLNRQLGNLPAAGHGADVTFQVDGETFRAHSVVPNRINPMESIAFFFFFF
ncbi:hypothetical protein BAE44_0016891 [Dichanthelium oligosanthes]|uniref:MATH domain-containing protein n=1 Tax=Dichanthelium oligosanthes TaxID=888268 RepID=A0A1E5VAG3_9POAL|nr:hypothetical protein BAE44_0016891 [Dichanthelium oligosanthes]